VCKNTLKQRLLVSIRGKKEAVAAYKGGAHIIDVEYPASALGTPYPLNIHSVRLALPKRVDIATNIGEEQTNRSTACQAALGVALAGADIIKIGLAKYPFKEAVYLGESVVRTIKQWFPSKLVIPAVFADKSLRKILDPISEGPELAKRIKADGVLIDTFNKERGLDLLGLMTLGEISNFVKGCHKLKIQAWIAGSITIKQLPVLWETAVDVICVRAAACASTKMQGRFGEITVAQVNKLVRTTR
jgi:(5-formylfuran-3-yl)methyl phosphate synthase